MLLKKYIRSRKSIEVDVGMIALLKKLYKHNLLRFIFVGGTNTVIGYTTYLLLLTITSYNVAYSITFLLTIIVSYCLNLSFVFKQKHSAKKLIQFPLVYLFQYVLGLIVLNFLIYFINLNQEIAPLVLLFISTPLTYLSMRFVFKKERCAIGIKL